MTAAISALSIYEGFFSGGARILHTDLLLGLHEVGHPQRVLSIYGKVRREATVQPLRADASYRRLTEAGVPVTALRAGFPGPQPYRETELARVRKLATSAQVTLTLKEQPLALVNQAGLRPGSVITSLHRSDPANHPEAVAALRVAVTAGTIAALVCCAESARDAYLAAGFPADLLHVIPNGVDLRRFRPDQRSRAMLRRQCAIPSGAPVIVLAARYDVMKNAPLFLAAAARFLRIRPDAHILMCGAGMTGDNPLLGGDLIAAGLAADPRIHLLGIRDDAEVVFAASDVVALTSVFGEAAPLCLIEGMMCGAVPVTTSVGDAAALVAGRGLVTEPEPTAIADAWSEAVGRRAELLPALRAARTVFDRRHMIRAYAGLIYRVAGSRAAGAGEAISGAAGPK